MSATTGQSIAEARGGAARFGEWRLPFNPLWLLISPMILIVVGLLVTVFWLSFQQGLPGTADTRFTLDNYISLYADPFVVTALKNTVVFAASTVGVALFFGIAIAWLAERTDLPGKSLIYTLMSLGLLLPGFFLAMGWLFLLSPRIGVINTWLMGLADWLCAMTSGDCVPAVAPFNVTSLVGMGWVQGLSLAALTFILVSASFRSMDPALEEAANVHGASFSQMLRRVFIPLVFPGILASSIYIFTIAIATFDVPAILGLSARLFTFSTFVFTKSLTGEALPDYGSVAAMSVFMVLIAIGLSTWYGNVLKRANQFQVVTGKGYRPRLTELGRWTWPAWFFIGTYFALSKVLPLLLVIWASLLPFFQPPSLKALPTVSLKNFESIPFDLLARGATNTLVLVAVVPTLALIICFAFSWMVVRSRSPFRGLLDFFAFLPHAVPSIIFGVGAAFAALFILRSWLPVYGTVTLLAIVYVVDRLSFGTRLLNSALIQVHRELEESAAMSGATGLRIARSILAPLVSPALLNGWLWMAIQTYRELTLPTILFSPANIVMSVVIWNIWYSGKFGVASAITLILLAGLAPLVMVYWGIGRRYASGTGAASMR